MIVVVYRDSEVILESDGSLRLGHIEGKGEGVRDHHHRHQILERSYRGIVVV